MSLAGRWENKIELLNIAGAACPVLKEKKNHTASNNKNNKQNHYTHTHTPHTQQQQKPHNTLKNPHPAKTSFSFFKWISSLFLILNT